MVALVGVTSLLLAAAAVGVSLKISHDNTVARHRREAQAAVVARRRSESLEADVRAAQAREHAEEAARAAEAKKKTEVAAEAKKKTEVSERQTLEHELENSIAKDARERVNEGELKGPILRTSCTPVAGGSSRNLAASTGTFTCIAVKEITPDGAGAGRGYSAVIDFAKGTYTWSLEPAR
jgi:hypothetical protein